LCVALTCSRQPRVLLSFPTRRSSDLGERFGRYSIIGLPARRVFSFRGHTLTVSEHGEAVDTREVADPFAEVERLRAEHSVPRLRSEEHTSELQSRENLVCRLLLEKKK